MQTELAERHLTLQGVFNFRDVGGYRAAGGNTVAWRRLFRADGIHRLNGADLDRVASLGLRTVIDLRTPAELAERGRFPVELIPTAHHHLPVLEAVWDQDRLRELAADVEAAPFLAARYEEMLDQGGPALARAFDLLADPASYPAVFHCAAGKDRTGVLAALTLSLLGVAEEDIAGDYALSQLAMARMSEWIVANVPGARDAMVNQPAAFLEAPVEAMHLFLAGLRQSYGSAERYVSSIGVQPNAIRALRSNLLV